MVEKIMVEKSGVEKSRVEMSSLYNFKGHFNPRLFNHELFNPEVLKFLKSSWLKNLRLKGPGLKLGFEKSGVEMSFKYFKDLNNCRSVCKIWQNILLEKRSLWIELLEKEKIKTFVARIYPGPDEIWQNHIDQHDPNFDATDLPRHLYAEIR